MRVLLCAIDDAIQPFIELGRLSHLLIVGDTLAVEAALIGSSTELFAKKNVRDPIRSQLGVQLLAIEMWKES